MILRFADPAYLVLLLGVPLLAWWYIARGRGRTGSLRYSSLAAVARADRRRTGRWRHALFVLRSLGLAALVVAFARPQTGVTAENVTTEGIDIVLALDLSTSMLAEDLEPNRIEAAKAVAADFVEGRRNDRIGLVVFAGDAFTQVPLTLDYGIVTTVLGELETGILEDGTAIGMGLATAVKRLQDSSAESKVVVLLTDGQNNRGEIDPVTAAQLAAALDIRIYAVGAGTRGVARVPVDDPLFGRRYAQMRGRHRRADPPGDGRSHGRPLLPGDRPREPGGDLGRDRRARDDRDRGGAVHPLRRAVPPAAGRGPGAPGAGDGPRPHRAEEDTLMFRFAADRTVPRRMP